MKEYERLTDKNDLYWALQETKLSAEVGIYLTDCLNQLAELEDKIENGTLVEIEKPFIRKYQSIPPQDKYFICKAQIVYLSNSMSKAEAEAKLLESKGEEK